MRFHKTGWSDDDWPLLHKPRVKTQYNVSKKSNNFSCRDYFDPMLGTAFGTVKRMYQVNGDIHKVDDYCGVVGK